VCLSSIALAIGNRAESLGFNPKLGSDGKNNSIRWNSDGYYLPICVEIDF
jgi:hypothetical protein